MKYADKVQVSMEAVNDSFEITIEDNGPGIVKAQIDGEKPSYKVRQGMSMFLGAPLSAELMPQNIAAAQAVFVQKKAQQEPDKAPGKSSKTHDSAKALSKSDKAYLTSDQARETRQQRTS